MAASTGAVEVRAQTAAPKSTVAARPPILPAGINYRFQLTYQSEELRLKWVNSDTHTKVWAGIDAALKDKKFQVLLFDVV